MKYATRIPWIILCLLTCCTPARADSPDERSMLVTATAYNSLPSQTDGHPGLAAWGDELEPGMKTVAVSRDLLAEGLTRGTTVRIEGLQGDYTVLDKTAARHSKRIDIYMGVDVQKALNFGVRKVRIWWGE